MYLGGIASVIFGVLDIKYIIAFPDNRIFHIACSGDGYVRGRS